MLFVCACACGEVTIGSIGFIDSFVAPIPQYSASLGSCVPESPSRPCLSLQKSGNTTVDRTPILILHVRIYVYGKMPKRAVTEERQRWPHYLESIIFSLRYKAGPQGALLNPEGGARFAIDGR